MGVIDLDARVKKLEQDATGRAVIDQLESAVTAIENELTVTTTDVTDDCTFGDLSNGAASIQTYGKVSTVILTAENSTDTAITQSIYTIPDEIMFSTHPFIGDPTAVGVVDGAIILTLPAGESITTTLFWIIDPPAPTPGE